MNARSTRLLAALLGSSCFVGTPATATGRDTPEPARRAQAPEERAIWVTRWDYRTRADVLQIVSNCASLGLNRIYFQVRGRADAFYRSSLEPWGEEIGGRDPGFDPLAVAVEAAHARGVELHAWVNALSGWKGKTPPVDVRHIYHSHPEWFLQDRNGKRYRLREHYSMVNPCLPEVRRHIVAVTRDIVSRYSVDGLQLDYIRFCGFKESVRRWIPYDARTLAQFRERTGGFPGRNLGAWDDFRCEAVDRLVREVAVEVRSARPGCQLSAAVLSDFDRARKLFFQDPRTWLRQGWVDRVIPMTYERDAAAFTYRSSLALKRAGAGRVVAGIGAHLFSSGRPLEQQVEAARSLGCRGFAIFAYTSFFPSPSHASRSGEEAERLRAELRSSLLRVTGAVARNR